MIVFLRLSRFHPVPARSHYVNVTILNLFDPENLPLMSTDGALLVRFQKLLSFPLNILKHIGRIVWVTSGI